MRDKPWSTSIVAASCHTSAAWFHSDGRPSQWGHVDAGQHGLSPFYRLYECADSRWLFVAAVRPEHRASLAAVIGEERVALESPEKVGAILESRFEEHPAAHWCKVLDAAGVPAEVVDEEYCRASSTTPTRENSARPAMGRQTDGSRIPGCSSIS